MAQQAETTTTKTTEVPAQQYDWLVIDAKGRRLGRVATAAAQLLLGKHRVDTKAYLVPNVKVIVLNAAHLDITEIRSEYKIYTRYSGYPGGLTTETLGELKERIPERTVEKAIKGMLPKGKRGRAIHATNLYVYAEAEHPHTAHQPKVIDLDTLRI